MLTYVSVSDPSVSKLTALLLMFVAPGGGAVLVSGVLPRCMGSCSSKAFISASLTLCLSRLLCPGINLDILPPSRLRLDLELEIDFVLSRLRESMERRVSSS